MAGRHATETYVDEAVSNATGRSEVASPVTSDETVSHHGGHLVALSVDDSTTALDMSGPVDLLGGAIFGARPGLRITVDGEVVLNHSGNAAGRDDSGDNVGMISVPYCHAETSLLVEVLTSSASAAANDYGWRMYTR